MAIPPIATSLGSKATREYFAALQVLASGDLVAAGQTAGALPGAVSAGEYDIFLTKLTGDGSVLWVGSFLDVSV